MTTPIQQNLESKNVEYAAAFTKGHLALPPAKKYLIVTCMDARIDPAAAYGIDLGDAHVIRNAGGNALDALRSIVISQQLLGTREIILIKHTGCGMLTFTNEEAHALTEQTIGEQVRDELAALGDFQAFPDLEEAVRRDIELLKSRALVLKDIPISGWVYEVETGKVRRVV
ncbi:hypothetical protein AJ80_06222 [Polytolypa hystricis UAMH7299]|uniref:Carbonic anhydrase n=1 Tax=Polytolypa hystricis (strain UAMH7299) TaxID=1447883 RepID=A0A2B7XZ17_POLH7|nr:hypothetical protein AJ80_06222 [Polytolypa hystricis UAMH7299]